MVAHVHVYTHRALRPQVMLMFQLASLHLKASRVVPLGHLGLLQMRCPPASATLTANVSGAISTRTLATVDVVTSASAHLSLRYDAHCVHVWSLLVRIATH